MSRLVGGIRRQVDARPVLVVLVLAVAVAVGHHVWIATQRPPGSYNPDEAGYLATALVYERTAVDGLADGSPSLGPLWSAVAATTNGPLVPLLSVPAVAVGGRTVHWAMVPLPWFHVLAAVAVAGIVARLAGPRRAVVAGALVLGLPGALVAGRSYVYALPSAALLATALWCLLASDRGRRRWPMVAFGAVVGALVLARTMNVALLPAVAAAAAIVVVRERRALGNVGLAALVALVVALPWWLAAGDDVVAYLVDYGYTAKADPYGSGGVPARVGQRLGALVVDARPLLLAVLVAWLVVVALARRRPRPDADAATVAGRRALWAAVGLGYLALLSSQNTGIWFELPVEVLAVAGVVSMGLAVPAARARAVGVAALAVVAANALLVGVWRLGVEQRWEQDGREASASMLLFGDMYQPLTSIRTADPMLMSDPGDRRRAAGDWWAAHRVLADAIDAQRSPEGLVHQTVTGNDGLINANSLLLHQETSQRPPTGWDVPDSTAADLGPWLTPTVGRVPRVLVVLRSEQERFPGDAGSEQVADEAGRRGWQVEASVPLPDGGEALVLVPPA